MLDSLRAATVSLVLLLGCATPSRGQHRETFSPSAAAIPESAWAVVVSPPASAVPIDLPLRPGEERPARGRTLLYVAGGLLVGGLGGYVAHEFTRPSDEACSLDNGLTTHCEARSYLFALGGASLGGVTGLVVAVLRQPAPSLAN